MIEIKKITPEQVEELEDVITVSYDDQPNEVAENFVAALEMKGVSVTVYRIPGGTERYYRIHVDPRGDSAWDSPRRDV